MTLSSKTHLMVEPDLTEPIDVYSDWLDAAEAAQRAKEINESRRAAVSSSKPRQRAEASDDD